MRARVAIAVAATAGAAALLGCGPPPHSRAAGALTPLSVRPVAWNPGGADVGRVRAVADAGNVVAVFGDAGATVLSSGASIAVDRSVTDWAAATTIAGADGSAHWIVGVDGKGRLYYLRGLSSFDDVSGRYGLDGRRLRGAAMIDAKHVGFLLDRQIAVADGKRVTLYAGGQAAPAAPDPAQGAAPAWLDLAGGAGRGAIAAPDAVVSFDAASMTARSYPLPGVAHVAVGADGRLYAATARAVYASGPDGRLDLVFDAEADRVHGLVASGAHVWFADGPELGVVDGDHVAETTGARLAPDASLAPSSSGDVWVIAGGALQRFSRADPEPALAATWKSSLAPVFARVCASCHQPGGSSGTDLSTAEAWESERQAIRERVVVTRTMPPEGHPLTDADRDAIRAWAEVKASP
jgi:mono/diheme cytochrome c family protein